MEVHFVSPNLHRLDRLKSEALSVPFFADERPLRGTLGLVDWRMCGQISRLILSGRVTGKAGEKTLIPPRSRLPLEKLLLLGLGAQADFDEHAFRQATTTMLDTLTRAQVRASVMVLPGRAMDLIRPDRAMEIFLQMAADHEEHDEVTLLEDVDAQKSMAPVVRRERQRARAKAL